LLLSRSACCKLTPTKAALKRALGPWQLIALGIGAIIGAGIFTLTGVGCGNRRRTGRDDFVRGLRARDAPLRGFVIANSPR
jgi:hypothetical protein